ncbi:MAG: hypothetical protein Q4F99_00425 [bacterium]|nr:hypothetical protein [bacterium]
MANNYQSSTLLLCAYTLAKAKRYAEAEAMILSNAEISKTAPAIDLLARLRIEQGDIIEARRLWEELTATHPDYLPARNALKHFETKSTCFTKKRCVVIAMFLLLGLGIFIGHMLNSQPKIPTPQVYTWATLPRYVDLQYLNSHKGNVKRLSITSNLFADPTALARRQNLIDTLTYLLKIEPHQIYFAQNTPEASADVVVITIENN